MKQEDKENKPDIMISISQCPNSGYEVQSG